MHDVVCVGDATIDALLSIHKDCKLYQVPDGTWLCLKYGEKIPVDSFKLSLGGIAGNVSVGLSRMDLKSALCAEIGDDELSQKIENDLKKENVSTELLLKTKGETASLAVGINLKNERTLFVGHVKRKHNFNFDGVSAHWLYLGGLGEEWEEPYKKVLDYVQKNNLRLAFTPGSAQLEELNETVFEVLKKTEVLLVNKTEGERIVRGLNGQENDPSKILVQLQKLGAKRVVMTDGKNGSYAIDKDGKVYSLGFFPCNVVEKTGAGDAYTSGFLGAVLYGKNVEEAMRWGAVNAASVIEYVGAQKGLLVREEIEQRMTNF